MAPVSWRPSQQLGRCHVPLHQPHPLTQHLGPLPRWEARLLQLLVRGRGKCLAHEGLAMQGQLSPRYVA